VTRIEIENFGPIAEADVDMKPLMVFMGPNSSGKSYLALLIYSLARLLDGDSQIILPGRYERRSIRRLNLSKQLVKRASNALKKAWPNPEDIPDKPPNIEDLPKAARDMFKQTFQLMGEGLAADLAAELRRCFGTQISSLGRRGLSVQHTGFRVKFSDSAGSIWELRTREDELVTSILDHKLPLSDFFDRISYPPWPFFVDDPTSYLSYLVRNKPNSILTGLAVEIYQHRARRICLDIRLENPSRSFHGLSCLLEIRQRDRPELVSV